MAYDVVVKNDPALFDKPLPVTIRADRRVSHLGSVGIVEASRDDQKPHTFTFPVKVRRGCVLGATAARRWVAGGESSRTSARAIDEGHLLLDANKERRGAAPRRSPPAPPAARSAPSI